MEDRTDILDTNVSGVKVLYIVDIANSGNEGQYPEALMKIPNKQKYCFLLSSSDRDYDEASMKVVYYDKNMEMLTINQNDIVLLNGGLLLNNVGGYGIIYTLKTRRV